MVNANASLDGIGHVLAPNASPMTLGGTNTWIVEGWVVDPGPAIPSHVDAVRHAAGGGVEGVVLTHAHSDHAEAAPQLSAFVCLPLDGERVGPFLTIGTPGHSADSVCLLYGHVLFTGDTVLGEGSVFVAPGDGSLSAYLRSLERLLSLDVDVICPGHGPVVRDPQAKLREYLSHRRERERRLVEALAAGARSVDELLARAWADVDVEASPMLHAAASATLAAHLEKLGEEGRLPDGVATEALAGPQWSE